MNIGRMYTNISIVAYPVFGVFTLAGQWEYMRIVCRRSRVQNPFAFFFNLLVYTGTYWYIHVYAKYSTYLYTLVYTSMYFHQKVKSEIIVK